MSRAFSNILVVLSSITFIYLFSATTQAAAEGWPRTISHQKGALTIKAKPLRIVSTSPSLTGVLLAIDAPLIATAATTPSALTDSKGFFTQWAKVADERHVEILYSNLQFDLEAIIALQPDLVIGSSTGADSILDFYGELQAQQIPTIVINYAQGGWQDLARMLGRATGLEKHAEAAITQFDQTMVQAAQKLNVHKSDVTIVGYNIGGSYSIGKPESPQAEILTGLGFNVLGLPQSMKNTVSRSSDFDFISHENLSSAIDGKSVFLMRGTNNDVASFLADPVLQNLPAVKSKHVYPLGLSSFRIDYYSGLQMIYEILAHYQEQ
ncbi:Fe2+-enterobactin ABC transporter substrate-binding protein [Bartonella sp. LJL80]